MKEKEIKKLRENYDKSDELLFQAYNEEDYETKVSLVKEAIDTHPRNYEARRYYLEVTASESFEKTLYGYRELIKEIKNDFENRGYYKKKDFKNCFDDHIETMPYLKTLYSYAMLLIQYEFYYDSIHLLQESLLLVKDDVVGFSFLLAVCYAYTKNVKELEKVAAKAKNQLAFIYFPLAIAYYQKGEIEKSKEIVKKVNDVNTILIEKFLNEEILKKKRAKKGYRCLGSETEAKNILGPLHSLLGNTIGFSNMIQQMYEEE